MHDAPSVCYPVGRCLWCRRIQLGLWASALVAALAVVHMAARPLAWSVGLFALGVLGAVYLWRASPSSAWLAWRSGHRDQRGWWWCTAPDEMGTLVVELSVLMDLQVGMLVNIRLPARQALTVWLSRHEAPQAWLSLRQAIWHHTGDRA